MIVADHEIVYLPSASTLLSIRKFNLRCGDFVRVRLAVPAPELLAFACPRFTPVAVKACACHFDAHHLPLIRLLRSTFQAITLMPLSDSDDAIRQPAGER